MSDLDDTQPIAEAVKKMTKYNKNVVSLMDMMKKALEKLEAVAVNNKAVDYTVSIADKEKMDASSETSRRYATSQDEKVLLDKIFEKKQMGRPRGSWEEKQQQYLKMLNEGKIKMPKSQTLEFYKIEKDGEVFKTIET